jgi:hypothetical protein
MTQRTLPLCVTYVALLCASSFGSEPANCPDSIDVNQQLTAPVSGWTTMIDDSPPRLANITFYDGPPQQRASLIYDQKMRVAGKETATWHFLPRADRQIWVGCSYTGTGIVLIMLFLAYAVSALLTGSATSCLFLGAKSRTCISVLQLGVWQTITCRASGICTQISLGKKYIYSKTNIRGNFCWRGVPLRYLHLWGSTAISLESAIQGTNVARHTPR